MVNNHQYNKNYYLTICICISSGSGTVSWAPTQAGTYCYICSLHGGMVGTITVN